MKQDPGRRRLGSFLLTQLGTHASGRFAERLKPLGLTPPDVGVLRMLKLTPGLSQQELSSALGIHPSRLVAILDQLESAKLVQRRIHAEDRRSHALQLTERGLATFAEVGQIYARHHDALFAALTHEEQEALVGLLERIAAEQKLTPGMHPGYRRL